MIEKENLPEENYPCSECQAGVLRPRYITYFTWLGEELITVPDFPAWICDVCGRREYDSRALSWLTILLTPNAGHKTEIKRKTQYPQRSGGDGATPIMK